MSGPKPSKEVFRGLFGEFALELAGDELVGGSEQPKSEVSPLAILFQGLTVFGALIGSRVFMRIDAKKHPPSIFCLVVGKSSRSRKGSSLEHVLNLFEDEIARFPLSPVVSGLSSGEGFVSRLTEPDPENEGGRRNRKENQSLVILSEFASLLQVKRREGNTVSAMIRDAWDSRPLEILTKHDPIRCSEYHLGMIGHITLHEFRSLASAADYTNGLFNRFLLIYVDRGARLASPPGLSGEKMIEFRSALRTLMEKVSQFNEITMSDLAKETWEVLYQEITSIADEDSRVDGMIARSEAYVLRLAMVYTLSCGRHVIEPDDLTSARAAWKYCYESTKLVVGNLEEHTEKVIQHLKANFDRSDRSDLYGAFKNNICKQELDRALKFLEDQQAITITTESTNGRPRQTIHFIGEGGRRYERSEFTN